MPAPRSSTSPKNQHRPKAAPPASTSSRVARLRPELSRRGVARIAGRAVGVCAVVGVMTVAAGWHSSGMVRRGDVERMVRMSANVRSPAAEAKGRGRLDKGRLEAMAASASR